jgi:4-amino-4-deoxy-L-arabinose transferase-like glycosyltransferase
LAAVAVLLAITWLPRGLAPDRIVTPDEPAWLTNSANFYRALTRGQWADTYEIEHPGVTVTWLGLAAYVWRYPTYPQDSPAQFDWWSTEVEPILLANGHSPLELVTAGHIFMAVAITLVLVASAAWAVRLLGFGPGGLGMLLIAADPFHIGLSRLLHVDALMSSLMLLSLLALLCYLYRGRRWADLIVSAAAAGLAWLTKSPSLFLVPFTALIVALELADSWQRQGRLARADWLAALRALVVWGAVAGLVFVALWPSMWVDPIGTVWQVLRGAAGYAVKGHDIATYFNGVVTDGDPGWSFYPVTYLWRTTPAVLFGLVLLAGAALRPSARTGLPQPWRVLALLALFAVLFTIFMTLGAKKFDRYLLPIYAPLALLAAAGWFALLRGLQRHWPQRSTLALSSAILVVVFASQQALVFASAPYFLSYYNPLLGGTRRAPQVMMVGWGEGLDQAARYLNAHPGPRRGAVMVGVWGGTFSYFYHGEIRRSDFSTGADTARDWAESDYAVIYINQWQRQRLPAALLAYLNVVPPALTVRLQGLDYVHVYDIHNLPPPPYMAADSSGQTGAASLEPQARRRAAVPTIGPATE